MPYKDPVKQAQAKHESYLRHKSEIDTKRQIRRRKNRTWFRTEIMSKLKCTRCLESNPVCLDFHHLDPKTKRSEVTKMVNESRNRNDIFAEIAKCIVLCANCHRKEHGWQ